jgi:hypothetical protein
LNALSYLFCCEKVAPSLFKIIGSCVAPTILTKIKKDPNNVKKYSLLCTPVLFDNEDTPGYFTVCDKTMEKQIAEFDQQLGITHELGCTIMNTDWSAEVKVKLVHVTSEINHGNKL